MEPDSAGIQYKCSSRIQFDFLHDHIRSCSGIFEAVKDDENTERTALHLCAFLAHWGMFRASGSVRNMNLYFFKEICHDLLGKKGVLLPIAGIGFEDLHTIEVAKLTKAISDVEDVFKKVREDFKPTDTMISKTILGLLGNVPGYDKHFKKGLRKLRKDKEYEGTMEFGAKALLDLSEWCRCTEYDWPRQIQSQADKRRYLPMGRLVDMAIHQYGKEEK